MGQMKKLMMLGLMLALVVPMAIVLTACGGGGTAAFDPTKVTQANLNQVTATSTQAQVEALLGRPQERFSASDMGVSMTAWVFHNGTEGVNGINRDNAIGGALTAQNFGNATIAFVVEFVSGGGANVTTVDRIITNWGAQPPAGNNNNNNNNNQQQDATVVGTFQMQSGVSAAGAPMNSVQLGDTRVTLAGGPTSGTITGVAGAQGSSNALVNFTGTTGAPFSTTWSLSGNTLTTNTGLWAQTWAIVWSNNNNTMTLTGGTFGTDVFVFNRV